ncbi:MAG: 3-dehydroquinate synthase, partial [Erythrobacter sp.]|nr:3-dehydroquinate synthase [Erythrobacter sp.]
MSSPTTIRVELSGRSYDVLVGPGLIGAAAALAGKRLRKSVVAVVADEAAWGFHGAALTASLAAADKEVALFPVPS